MRLIDADALKKKLMAERDSIPLIKTERYGLDVRVQNPHGMSMRGGINKAFRCMEQTPTIDAVPVVRCKDCKHFVEGAPYDPCECMKWTTKWGVAYTELDGFCSYGEKRDE